MESLPVVVHTMVTELAASPFLPAECFCPETLGSAWKRQDASKEPIWQESVLRPKSATRELGRRKKAAIKRRQSSREMTNGTKGWDDAGRNTTAANLFNDSAAPKLLQFTVPAITPTQTKTCERL